MAGEQTNLVKTGEIAKLDDERHVVWGWASVYAEKGQVVTDHQDDQLDEDTVVTAAHEFIRNERIGKMMHAGEQVGEIVESIVFTKDLQKALGIDLGKEGWLIGMHVSDPAVWSRVKSGELKSFSIGATCMREAA
jgi:hypothetical protein